MTERPILFSAPMVRALLAGTKTQTRRLVKPQPFRDNGTHGYQWHGGAALLRAGYGAPYVHTTLEAMHRAAAKCCPYGQPGDRLWVRETWGLDQADNGGDRHWRRAVYRADPGAQPLDNGTPVPWKPSIHMPRWASRITLEVTGVRVERLQDISAADAVAEGVRPEPRCLADDDAAAFNRIGPVANNSFPIARYAALWESINGPGSWAANPWVWVVEFRPAPPAAKPGE